MIKVNVHTDATGLQNDLPLNRISDTLHRSDSLLWVDLIAPTPDELRLVGQEFAFHPLAMEDAARRHQRPKLDHYDGFLLLVFYGLQTENGRPRTREVTLFAGKNYLVTVHDGSLPEIPETADRWCQNVANLGNRGVGLLVYSLLDALVDGYFPCIDELADRVEELETAIFKPGEAGEQAAIFALKKDLLAIRRVLGPERDVMNVLVRRDAPVFGVDGASVVVYFQDVYDHILRVTDAVDTYRDLLSSALDAHLSMTSFRLNEVVRRLTASSIILMSITLIAGIYGMNFEHMPELSWTFGYPFALGLMTAVAGALVVLFRRIHWL
ncbi:MAG: Magnesium and cobalt transport protein CorA [uncultured Thermomicrobiales bacterium]|uniref:Magnesium transport protein CorA n=1 Tax=uncultured Thermomicrobiales bacterium TaxID=1645740 RepID=A0A6J4UR61_9BACT|nr:MAG: Magnesium and cobalt transport protein CorA [uncultured Thermomicrobiales bacterium]